MKSILSSITIIAGAALVSGLTSPSFTTRNTRNVARILPHASGPRFFDNYLIRTPSADQRYGVLSVPYFCTNERTGCIKVFNRKTGAALFTFETLFIAGRIHLVLNDSTTVIAIPTGIGTNPTTALRPSRDRQQDNIFIYRNGVLTDTIAIPAICVTPENKKFFYTGRVLDRSKLLYAKRDTLAIVTNQGVALLTNRAGQVSASLKSSYKVLKTFRRLMLDAQKVCFPYPQPTTCEEIPVAKLPTGNKARN